jgi:EF hand
MNMLDAATLGLLAGLVASAPSAVADCGAGQDGPGNHASDCGRAEEQLIPIDDDLDAARQLFERIDQNRDGQITPEEWADWYDTEFAAAASAQGSSRAAN